MWWQDRTLKAGPIRVDTVIAARDVLNPGVLPTPAHVAQDTRSAWRTFWANQDYAPKVKPARSMGRGSWGLA